MEFITEDPVHPGVLLRDDFFHEYGLSMQKAAADLGMNTARLVAVVAGEAPLDADLALRLSRYFGTTAEFWLNLQRGYDLSTALRSAKGLDDIRPIEAA